MLTGTSAVAERVRTVIRPVLIGLVAVAVLVFAAPAATAAQRPWSDVVHPQQATATDACPGGPGAVAGDDVHDARTGLRYYTPAAGTVAVRTGVPGQSSTLNFLAADPQGTTNATWLASAPGTTRTKRYTDAYGAPINSPTWPDAHRFLNKSWDGTAGVATLGARTYDPQTGRFLSVDPVLNPSDPTSMESYGYSDENPANESDPDGTCPHDIDGCADMPDPVYPYPGLHSPTRPSPGAGSSSTPDAPAAASSTASSGGGGLLGGLGNALSGLGSAAKSAWSWTSTNAGTLAQMTGALGETVGGVAMAVSAGGQIVGCSIGGAVFSETGVGLAAGAGCDVASAGQLMAGIGVAFNGAHEFHQDGEQLHGSSGGSSEETPDSAAETADELPQLSLGRSQLEAKFKHAGDLNRPGVSGGWI